MHIEKHPFPEFIPKNVKTLIVGSFPPIKLTVRDLDQVNGENKHLYGYYFLSKRNQRTDADKSFYYGSRENLFWDLMKDAFGIPKKLETAEDIKSFLGANLIGITDVIEKCQRNSSKRKPTKANPRTESIGSLDKDLKIITHRDVVASIIKNNIERVYCTSKYVLKELEALDENGFLEKIKLKVLLSPSPAASIPISKKQDYIDKKKEDQRYDTKMYRIEKYREAFGLNPA